MTCVPSCQARRRSWSLAWRGCGWPVRAVFGRLVAVQLGEQRCRRTAAEHKVSELGLLGAYRPPSPQ